MARQFKYSRWKLLCTLIGIALLIGLGVWQVERLRWKTELIRIRTERQQLPTLENLPKEADYHNLEYRRVNLTGLIEESKMVFLGPRTFNGRVGYHLLTPVTLSDGRSIIVNQGFIPSEFAQKAYPQSQVQVLSGTLVPPPVPGPFTPRNPPVYDHVNGDKYYWVDLMALGTALGTQRLVPLIFEADKIGSDYPIGGQGLQDLPNDHLQYAIFWFTMAGILLVIYLLSSFRVQGVTRNKLHLRKSSDNTTKYPNLWG